MVPNTRSPIRVLYRAVALIAIVGSWNDAEQDGLRTLTEFCAVAKTIDVPCVSGKYTHLVTLGEYGSSLSRLRGGRRAHVRPAVGRW